jgi:hypothetical protein
MIGFELDIRPLFREVDREEMDFVFDLWDHAEVKANAERILERLEDRTMPCDGEWSDENIQLFRAWINQGCGP